MRRTLAILLAACALPCAAADFRAFDASSPAMIRAEQAGKPFVLAFWSVTCEPCRDEMPLWKAMRKKYPRLPIVLVAADPPADHAAATRFLKQYDPGSVQRWAFADDFAERVRYSVDKGWRGELPRTYFYDARHRGEARSGVLDKGEVEAWFAGHAAARRTSTAKEAK